MNKSTKVIILLGCIVSGALNGFAIIKPELAVMLMSCNAGLAMIVAAVTGISIARNQ